MPASRVAAVVVAVVVAQVPSDHIVTECLAAMMVGSLGGVGFAALRDMDKGTGK
jgi:hypothetical protein